MRIDFQEKLQEDIQLIKSLDKAVTFIDKTIKLARLTKEEYDHMINIVIASKYKKASNIKNQINTDGQRILKRKEVLSQLKINGKNTGWITLKDYNCKAYRSDKKNELGVIS